MCPLCPLGPGPPPGSLWARKGSCGLPVSLRQLLGASQNTGCHLVSRPGQLAFGDWPGPGEGTQFPNARSATCGLESPQPRLTPRGEGWGVCLYLGSVHPQEYSRMSVLAGHRNSMSSTRSFLKRENGPREGAGFLRGLRGPSAHMAHRPAHTCGPFSHRTTHSPQMGSLRPWRLVALAVTRGQTPGLSEPGTRTWGHCLQGGAGLQAGEPWAGLSPQHQRSTDGPGQPGAWESRGGHRGEEATLPKARPQLSQEPGLPGSLSGFWAEKGQGESCSSLRGSWLSRIKFIYCLSYLENLPRDSKLPAYQP